MEIDLGPIARMLVERLAEEEETSVEVMLLRLVDREDRHRHQRWDSATRRFARRRCSRPNCQEFTE